MHISDETGNINNPLESAVWAELNNFSGMQSIITNFYSIIDFHFKFCQVNRGIINPIENYSRFPPSAGIFLPDSKCHGKQSNNILKFSFGAEFPVCKRVS